MFKMECERVKRQIESTRKENALVFALVTDSHLSDNTELTCRNIRIMDEDINYDFLVHMGDLLNGNNPEVISRKNLLEALEQFRNSIQTRQMYIARGNHDGYRDESYLGQSVHNINTDKKWYEDTCFQDENPNLSRYDNKPYFYVDFPDKKIRLIILSSNWYEHDETQKIFKAHLGFDNEQLRWLGEDALVTAGDGWNIMLFSHIAPLTELDGNRVNSNAGKNNMSDKGGGEAVALVRACKESACVVVNDIKYDYSRRKTNILCWCVGHIHGDFLKELETINFISLASQTAYVPQLWTMPFGYFPEPREVGAVSEDCWDSVVIDTQKRRIYFVRFGAGHDRMINY